MGKEALYNLDISSCPFCGDKNSQTVIECVRKTYYCVQCWSCDSKGPTDVSVEGAIGCWNSRINYK